MIMESTIIGCDMNQGVAQPKQRKLATEVPGPLHGLSFARSHARRGVLFPCSGDTSCRDESWRRAGEPPLATIAGPRKAP